LVLLAFAIVHATRENFHRWVKEHNRKYSSKEEYEHRFVVYMENMRLAKQTELENGGSAQFGETIFSDLTQAEFVKMYLMPRTNDPFPGVTNRTKVPAIPHSEANPNQWNWVVNGKTTGVYNQGQCGSCWAFSATESLESNWAIAGGQLMQLSMQESVSCDTQSSGCGGGFPTTVFEYAMQNGGIDSYNNYPYYGYASQCSPRGPTYAKPGNYFSFSGEQEMYSYLQQGTVTLCLYANPSVWQYYRGGIVTNCGPEPSNSDHCVQAVGYNTWNTNPNWAIRNSWGAGWGEGGFIQIAYGQELCGVGRWLSFVTDFQA